MAELRDSEPFVILDGAEPAEAGGGGAGLENLRLCKVCFSGRLFWVQLDGARPDCFEWLCAQLDLDPNQTTMSVAASLRDGVGAEDDSSAARQLSSSPELRAALVRFVGDDPEEPMRIEVQLNTTSRVSLLAQSFIVVEPIDEGPDEPASPKVSDGSLVYVEAGQLAGFESLDGGQFGAGSSTGTSGNSTLPSQTVSPLLLVGARNTVVQSWFDHVFAKSALEPDALRDSYAALASSPPCEHDDQIDRDIPRTFARWIAPGKQAESRATLRRVLRAVSQVISPGYVQGMNFICGFVLSSPLTQGTSEADVFSLVVGLMEGGAVGGTSEKYGFAGMFDQQMPKLNRLVYQVDALLPRIAPRIAAHLQRVGISTSLLFVPGWTLTMFTNKLSPAQAGPIFDYIMRHGFNALVRLCLAALVAFEEQLCTCDFELCLVQLTQHMWQGKRDAGEVVLRALELFTVSDDEIDALGVEYCAGGAKSVDSSVRRSGVQKKGKIAAPVPDEKSAGYAERIGETGEDSSWTVMQRPSRGVNLGVQLALGGVVTAALVGAGAWLYLKKGDARDGGKGRMKAK